MQLAVFGTVFKIKPIEGVNHLLAELERIWSRQSKPKILAITYTYTPDILRKLAEIGEDVRMISGKLPPDYKQMISGVLLTGGLLHFKGIIAWNDCYTTYYIGSGNLAASSGGDWGLLIEKPEGFSGFRTSASVKNYRDWEDPFEVIFSEIVKRETGGDCEVCGEHAITLTLHKGLFVCENCL